MNFNNIFHRYLLQLSEVPNRSTQKSEKLKETDRLNLQRCYLVSLAFFPEFFHHFRLVKSYFLLQDRISNDTKSQQSCFNLKRKLFTGSPNQIFFIWMKNLKVSLRKRTILFNIKRLFRGQQSWNSTLAKGQLTNWNKVLIWDKSPKMQFNRLKYNFTATFT